ncbi:MAG: hypothetical protein ACFB3T_09190 [Geminicoccaceae bacterium]
MAALENVALYRDLFRSILRRGRLRAKEGGQVAVTLDLEPQILAAMLHLTGLRAEDLQADHSKPQPETRMAA